MKSPTPTSLAHFTRLAFAPTSNLNPTTDMARDMVDVADLFEDDVDEKALSVPCISWLRQPINRSFTHSRCGFPLSRLRVASKFDAVDYDDLSNPSVMSAFYRRLFPAKQLYSWLNQDHGMHATYLYWKKYPGLTTSISQHPLVYGQTERSPSPLQTTPTS